MRYLGIDYGTKHVGIAVSNEDATMAFPHVTFSNDKKLIEKIREVVLEKKVVKIVIGESKNFSGKDNPLMEKVRQFGSRVEAELGLPVIFEPEFLTSVEARHIQGDNDKNHASAAALILKSSLDKLQWESL